MNVKRLLWVLMTLPLWGAVCAAAQPAEDPGHTLTIQIENDSSRRTSDMYYTSGERLSYTSPTGQLPGPLSYLGHALLGDGQQRFALDLSQYIFTPFNTSAQNPPLNDRPYAGILMGTVSLIQDTETTRTALALGLGVIGPAAMARDVQNGFHDLIRSAEANGWHSQAHNQPVVQLTGERTWRVGLGSAGALETDALPSISVGAGTFRIYSQAGVQFRIGQGLQSDFGVPRIRPGLTGTDAYVATVPFAWYVFAGVDGQAVAWDETLDGEPFVNSRHVSRLPLVGEFQAGFAVLYRGMRLTVTQILQSNEFRGQVNGTFEFTSAALSVKF
jgi:lipid A 3-O-deacylase